MADLLIDYTFTDPHVANPDGTVPARFTGTHVTGGPPNETPLGTFDHALDLDGAGSAAVDVGGLAITTRSFCVRLVFRADTTPDGPQALVESDLLPFALWVEPGSESGMFRVAGSVRPDAHGWQDVTTLAAPPLRAEEWHTADLVYDTDTAAVFLDGELLTVHAFPNGTVELLDGHTLSFGSAGDSGRAHFDGRLAAFQWYAGVPAALEQAVDEHRDSAAWFITRKLESVRPRIALGAALDAPAHDADVDAWVQHFAHGAIMYHDGVGAAFVVHGELYDAYRARDDRAVLGHLISDEGPTAVAGGRKILFSRGGIYRGRETGVVSVVGQTA